MFKPKEDRQSHEHFSFLPKKNKKKTDLIANVNLNPRLEVVEDLFKVPCTGSSQVTGITVRLGEEKTKTEKEKERQTSEREREGEKDRETEEVSMLSQTLATCLPA